MSNYLPPPEERHNIGVFFDKNKGHMPLSNFWMAEFTDQQGSVWPSVEHFYQAMKSQTALERLSIQTLKTPGEAKKAGRNVSLRSDWEAVKLQVMRAGLRYKFAPGTLEAEFLTSTTGMLTEGNWWSDTYWGVDINSGKGQNWLGWLLLAQREFLNSI